MTAIPFELRVITPTEAAQLLRVKRSNAPVRMSTVRSYAREMANGNWALNGDPIIVGKSGALLSGVLRLEASKHADASFPALVVRGIEDSTFETIDAVRRRTIADILSIRKENSGRVLAAALNVVFRYSGGDYVKSSKSASAQTILDMLAAHPEIRTSVELTKGIGTSLPHGVSAALHYLFSLVDPDAATLFFDDFRLEQPTLSAVAALKRQLETLASKGGSKRQPHLIGLAIKAWEAARKGGEVRLLRYDPDVDDTPMISELQTDGLAVGLKTVPSSSAGDTVKLATHDIAVELLDIKPSVASEMLAANGANRSVASYVVDKYARDMISGDWAVNGQTIKFGKSGRLLDGQHRLHACVKSGVAFSAVVVRGLDEKVFETFDLGARRSLADILIDRGEINTSTLAAVLRQVWLLESGLMTAQSASPTVAEMLAVLEANPRVRESVRWVHRIKTITAPTLLLALHFEFWKRDPTLADQFIERLSDGANLNRGHPILSLRDQLMRARGERKHVQADAERAAWIIKAWNAFAEGRTLDHIKWQTSGVKVEAFPEIRSPRKLQLAAE